MRYLSILLSIFLSLLFASTSYSQVVEWNKSTNDLAAYQWYSSWGAYNHSSHDHQIATDRDGNLYVAGSGATNVKIGDSLHNTGQLRSRFVAKITPSGKIAWIKSGAGSWYYYVGGQLALDSAGSIYLVDRFSGSSADLDGVTVTSGETKRWSLGLWKLDRDGNVKWGKTLATFKDTTGWIQTNWNWWYAGAYSSGALQCDRAGNLYFFTTYEDSVRILGGQTYSYPGYKSGLLLKMNSSGSQTWLREMPELEQNTMNYVLWYYREKHVLAVTPTGDSYFMVRNPRTFTFDDTVISHRPDSMCFIVKATANGKLAWRMQLGLNVSYYDFPPLLSLTCDATEDLYVSGSNYYRELIVGRDTLGRFGIARIGKNGSNVWRIKIHRADSVTALNGSWDYYTNSILSANGYGQLALTFVTVDTTIYEHHKFIRDRNTKRGYWCTAVLQINDRAELIWADILEGSDLNFPGSVAIRHDHGVYLSGSYRNEVVGKDTLRGSQGYLFKYSGVHLTTPSPGKPEYCAGDTVQVHFNATRKFHPSNVYKAQLSDTGGVFNRRVQMLGELKTNDSLGTISCVLPHNIVAGGTYRIKVTGSDPYYDATNPGPEFIIHGPPPVAIRAKSNKLCAGEVMDLTGLNCTTYKWSTGDTTESITIDKGGRYIVTGYNHIGCEANDTIDIASVPLPIVGLEIKGDTTFCEGGLMRLKVSGGTSYRWSNGETTQEIVVRESGLYTAAVSNADDCVKETRPVRVTVLDAPDKPIISMDSNVLVSSSDSNNQWYYYGKPIDGATGNTLVATQNGRYVVRVTNLNGCYAESEVATVTLGTSDVARDWSADLFEILYTPEPVVIYRGGHGAQLRIEVIDQLGAVVTVLHNAVEGSELRLTLPHELSSGVYYVRISTDHGVRTLKVVVAK